MQGPLLCLLGVRKMSSSCTACGENKPLATRKPPLCKRCYNRQYVPPKKKCATCGKVKPINRRDADKNPICKVCYTKFMQPQRKCSECGAITIIQAVIGVKKLCSKCYIRPYGKCINCNKIKPVHTRIYKKEGVLCAICYNYHRINSNEKNKIEATLRSRVRSAFLNYTKNGKVKSSQEYGINYNKIFEHIGPCPGRREDYHIDHIKPLCLFDLEDPIQVKQAFAPNNHQWLKREENLSKGSKYKARTKRNR